MTLERFFHLRARGTTVRTELIGGAATFTALSYIVVVQPALLATVGMDPGAVLTATCLSAAFATLSMGLWANYPIAVAPAMGHNFYFTLVVAGPVAAGGMGVPWPVALGANCLAALLFLFLSLVGLRERLLEAIPPPLQHALAAGIGLLITLVGFEWAGLVRASPGTLIALGDLHQTPTLVAIGGTLLTAILVVRRNRGAILLGTLATGAVAVGLGLVPFHGVFAWPPSLAPTLGRLDLAGALRTDLVPVVFVFLFLGLFDTVGTLVGIASQAGLLRDGRLPAARAAMATDALGTVVGNVLGTSTVTAYVESAAGVAAGARTGLANVMPAALLLAMLFFSPLAQIAGAAVPVGGVLLRPVVAPALITIGGFMLQAVTRLDVHDPPATIAAALTLVTIPFSFSITEGIAFGFISYSLLMIAAGRARQVHPLLYGSAVLLLLRYAFLR